MDATLIKPVLGGYYEDRRGRLVGPMCHNTDPKTREIYPFVARVAQAADRRYTVEGRFYEAQRASHADLWRVTDPKSHREKHQRKARRSRKGKIQIRYAKDADHHAQG